VSGAIQLQLGLKVESKNLSQVEEWNNSDYFSIRVVHAGRIRMSITDLPESELRNDELLLISI
jgi:hypothetical protein